MFFPGRPVLFQLGGSRIPDIQQKLHLSNAQLGAVLLGLPTGLLISLPLAGWLVTKFGSKKIVLTAAAVYACTLPLLGIVQNKTQLIATLFLFGMGGNMLNISVNTQAVGTEALYGRTIMATYHGLWSLAGFTGAAIGTLAVKLQVVPFQHFIAIPVIAWIVLLIIARNLRFRAT